MEKVDELKEDYWMAKKGLDIWKKLKNRYGISMEWAIIIFPEKDLVLNKLGLDLLPQYLQRKYLQKVLIISVGQLRTEKVSRMGIYLEIVTENEMSMLLKYYRLVQFAKNIVVVSYREPFGTDGMIDKEESTLRDYVMDAIYV